MKGLLILGILVCAFFVWVSFDAYNDRDEYIEACLYISDTLEQKRGCYNVYPENHKREWIIKGVASSAGILILGFWYLIIKDEHTPTA